MALLGFHSDFPASYHGGAGALAFADGHAEVHRWRDPRTMPPLQPGTTVLWGYQASPANADLLWLQQRATRRVE